MNNVAPPRAGGFQCNLDVGIDLPTLGFEIADADDLAVFVDRGLAGNEDELGGLHAAHLAIGTERMGKIVWIRHVDCDHFAFPFCSHEYCKFRYRVLSHFLHEASVPIPKFATPCGTLSCELRNRKYTNNFKLLVRFEFEVPMTDSLQMLIGTSNSPH